MHTTKSGDELRREPKRQGKR
uniref:Uncharacterized protein n=1 Tax=Arundo donax TaxID=35708 RepID=A0A0A9A479_ARUDO